MADLRRADLKVGTTSIRDRRLSHAGLQASQQQTSVAQGLSPAASSAVLSKYCITCHNEKRKTAGLAIDTLDLQRVGADAEVWEKIARKFRTHEMPPPGAPRPEGATYAAVTAHLENALDAAASAIPNPGRVPVHRLNRTEYANAIRNLLGLDIDARGVLPADDANQEGFDNVASVLTVSAEPLLEIFDQSVLPVVYVHRRCDVHRCTSTMPSFTPLSSTASATSSVIRTNSCFSWSRTTGTRYASWNRHRGHRVEVER